MSSYDCRCLDVIFSCYCFDVSFVCRRRRNTTFIDMRSIQTSIVYVNDKEIKLIIINILYNYNHRYSSYNKNIKYLNI